MPPNNQGNQGLMRPNEISSFWPQNSSEKRQTWERFSTNLEPNDLQKPWMLHWEISVKQPKADRNLIQEIGQIFNGLYPMVSGWTKFPALGALSP
jgi:hypothetical protein